MSTETLPQRKAGQKTNDGWFDLLRSILAGDFVPRALTGVASDLTALLSLSAYRWLNAYLSDSIYFGHSAGNNLRVNVSSSTATDYILTMPSALPSSSSPVAIDSSGNVSFISLGTTLDSTSTQLEVKDAGTTILKFASLGQQRSSGSGTVTNTTSSFTAITNMTVTITTTGRPVRVCFAMDDNGVTTNNIGTSALYRFLRNGTEIARHQIVSSRFASSAVFHIDTPAAGTYTYTAEHAGFSTGLNATLNGSKLLAYEFQ